MIEARKCARCGCMYIAETEVCSACQQKDGADLYRLKGFLSEGSGEPITQGELSIATGISNRNLARFLQNDELKEMYKGEKICAASGKTEGQEGIPDLV